jgi:membrane protease YdiL (CAAX protease family)
MLSVKPWRAEAVILFLAAQLICCCLGMALVGILDKAGFTAFKLPDGFGAVLLATLSFQGATWLLAWIFLRQHKLGWLEAFGFRGPRLIHALLLAVVTTAVVLPIMLELEHLSVVALTKLGWPPEDQAAVALVMNTKLLWARIYLALFTIVIAPLAEEFIFRGVLFPFVKNLGWPRLAWIGVSALFALIHVNAATFVPLFVFALALTWLYEKTNNLLAPITAHALFNAVNFTLLLWQNQHPHA